MNKHHHKLCKPARSIHIVPQAQNSLLSTSKVVDADYIAIYDKEEKIFYDAKSTRITVLEESVSKGWGCPASGLWWLPLVENPVNLNTDTLLLDHPTKLRSQNRLYTMQTTKCSQKHIWALLSHTNKEEYIHNVRGYTGDFPARKSKKTSWVPRTQKIETKKTSKPSQQNNSGQPQNCLFLISTMATKTHTGVHITR